jgi:hypothetical protein
LTADPSAVLPKFDSAQPLIVSRAAHQIARTIKLGMIMLFLVNGEFISIADQFHLDRVL